MLSLGAASASMGTGSVAVPAVCHAPWNGLDHPLCGFGEKVGALGIEETHYFGPEVGILGIGLNAAFPLYIFGANTRLQSLK